MFDFGKVAVFSRPSLIALYWNWMTDSLSQMIRTDLNVKVFPELMKMQIVEYLIVSLSVYCGCGMSAPLGTFV
jgi:hypothetical protein